MTQLLDLTEVRKALDEAIKSAGSQKRLAAVLGRPQSLISHWRTKGKKGVPANDALEIERVYRIDHKRLFPVRVIS